MPKATDSPGTPPPASEAASVPGRWPAFSVFVLGALVSGGLFANVPRAFLAGTVLVALAAILALCLGRTRNRPLAFLAGWLSPPAAGVLLFMGATGALGDLLLTRSFDAATWRAPHETAGRDRTRLRMVEDLRTSGRLDGLTRDEAVALLGEPDLSPFGEADGALYWRLAPMMVDHYWLRVRFGPDGRVLSHEVVND